MLITNYITYYNVGSDIVVRWPHLNVYQGLNSPTFYEQLLLAKIPKAQKYTDVSTVLLRLRDLCV